MEPRQAWGAFTLIFALADIVIAMLLVSLGYPALPVLLFASMAIIVYLYVVYKRYHVEVVAESELLQFDQIQDLRILSGIYGLETSGSEAEVRKRLVEFSRANKDKAFVWVAPKSVLSLGSTLSVPEVPEQLSGSAGRNDMTAPARISYVRRCPVCNSTPPSRSSTCTECGADLGFYAKLMETKVGKRLVSHKAVTVRRKLRYEVPPIGENR